MYQIAGPILGKIGEYLAAPVGRQLSYVFCFSSNVESLKIEADKLNDLKVGIQWSVDNGERNIEKIYPTVQKWLIEADAAIGDKTQNIIRGEAEFPKGCFNRWFLNFKSRYALSRSAKKITTVVVELQEQGRTFGNVSCPAHTILHNVATSSSITLDSRVSMLNDIMESLKDDEIRMIGICGMGGVGKTTMMGEVLEKAMEENLFDEYAKTAVSQKADSTKIQSDIAEMLGLTLDQQSLEVRAGRINKRLQGKKVLIILDDAWEELDLQLLGIDLKGSHKGCKMLYTSRIKGLWIEFGSKRCELALDVLPDHEAWNLFKKKVVDFPNDIRKEFIPIAEGIVKECGRLPLSLITLARALRGNDIYIWRDALSKLRMVGSNQKVIESLKLSYDHLGNDEAKSLFLLCGMFNEDREIDPERLVDMGMGLRLFKGISSVAAARDRVFALLKHLQDCYLITESFYRGKKYINVHDDVRDVSKSIASTEKGALIFECSDELKISQEQGTIEDSGWISVLSKDIKEFPTRLQCPRLELLICNNNDLHFADSCFEGMVKLQVVNLSCDLYRDNRVRPHNAPTLRGLALQYHKSLRTLCLCNCWMEDLTAIGNLPSLEILRVVWDKSITEVPKEIGKLTNLMVLDLSRCSRIVKISPGVISSLTNLEELYIFNSEIDWEIEGNDEGSNASLRELKALSKLHTLHIQIKDPRALPGIPLFGHLKKYSICVGYVDDFDSIFFSRMEKVLAISLTIDVPLEREFNFLLYNSESVVLKGAFVKDMALKFLREGSQTIVKHLEIRDIGEEGDSMDLSCDLYRYNRVPNAPTLQGLALQYHKSLRTLCLRNCWMEDLTAIGNLPSLEILRVVENKSITEVPKEIGKLANLMVLDLSRCSRIVKISPGVISSLTNLEELYIIDSNIDWEIEGNDEASNASLRELKALSKLHTLHIQIKDPRALPGIPLFGHLKKYSICVGYVDDFDSIFFSRMEKVLAISLTIDVPLEREFNFLLYNSESVVLKGAFVKDMAHKFLREGSQTIVKHLEISDIGEEGDSMDFTIAPSLLCTLGTLIIHHLHSARQIYCSPPVAGVFGKLEFLKIYDCIAMTDIFSLSPPNEGPQTIISSCDTPEEEVDATRSKFNFLELKWLDIRNMPKLESFCQGIEEIQFPQLSGLCLNNLLRIECIISSLSDESSSDPKESSIISLFPPKVSFHSLKEMHLSDLKNMKEIWCGQLQAGSFYNLAILELRSCDSLQYVFRPGMAKYLVHLDTLHIRNCRSLKEVIAAKTVEEEECMTSSSSILPKLKKVDLYDLPTLQRFCHVVDDLEFSELDSLYVGKCPEFKTFAPGFVHTPKLNHVELELYPGEKMIWKGDLNNTIQHYCADYKDNESPPHPLPNVIAAP